MELFSIKIRCTFQLVSTVFELSRANLIGGITLYSGDLLNFVLPHLKLSKYE